MNTHPLRTVILFGMQGSGKGTQAQLLKEHLESTTQTPTLYLETGQLLRDVRTEESYTSTLVDETVSAGGLLPSFVPIFALSRKMVSDFTGNEHLIFDGATRRVNQTVVLNNMLHFYKRAPYDVVLITLSEDSAVERLLKRGREDDTEEKIRKRIAWSNEHMDAVMRQFENFECAIHTIDGEPSIDAIHRDIRSALKLA